VAVAGPESAVAAYTLDFGTFVLKRDMIEIKKKIRKAGMVPVVVPGPKKKEHMSRIHVAEYTEKKAADHMIQKLRKAKGDCFILQDRRGKFNLYAGSYFDKSSAIEEQVRLARFGITTELRQLSVQVPTLQLSAGSFESEEAAARSAGELERAGVKAVVVPRPR
jgi:cell division protein FtsN